MQQYCKDQEEQDGQCPVITKFPCEGIKLSGRSYLGMPRSGKQYVCSQEEQ